jgi:hypothetical protein
MVIMGWLRRALCAAVSVPVSLIRLQRFRDRSVVKRRLEDVSRVYSEGYQPLASSFGQRGLGGPNVKSGIRRSGLSRMRRNFNEIWVPKHKTFRMI